MRYTVLIDLEHLPFPATAQLTAQLEALKIADKELREKADDPTMSAKAYELATSKSGEAFWAACETYCALLKEQANKAFFEALKEDAA